LQRVFIELYNHPRLLFLCNIYRIISETARFSERSY